MITRFHCFAPFAGFLSAFVWSSTANAHASEIQYLNRDGWSVAAADQPGPAKPETPPAAGTPGSAAAPPSGAAASPSSPTTGSGEPPAAGTSPAAGTTPAAQPSPQPGASAPQPEQPGAPAPAAAQPGAAPPETNPGEPATPADPTATPDDPTAAPAGQPPAAAGGEMPGVVGEGASATSPHVSAPLPPPPDKLDPSTIRSGPWRGVGWVAVHLTLTGPIGGDRPGRPTVLSSGFGLEFGWRLRNFIGVGSGISRQTHERRRNIYEDAVDGSRVSELTYGELTNFDILFARGYLPLAGRVQPYADIGGGIAVLESTDDGVVAYVGGHGRATLGADFWVSRNLTIGAGARYRLLSLDGSVGHMVQGFFQFGVHW